MKKKNYREETEKFIFQQESGERNPISVNPFPIQKIYDKETKKLTGIARVGCFTDQEVFFLIEHDVIEISETDFHKNIVLREEPRKVQLMKVMI